MKPVPKFILTLVIIAVVGSIYYSYIKPTDELGDFSKFSTNSEINQTINVGIVKSRGFERDGSGGITSLYGIDKNNVEMRITLHEPAPLGIVDAAVIELLGHLHSDGFVASQITVIK
ncbi:MAG: hypothetical protein HW389_1800 [Bacteroidetes bacterium]|nr:hypothetical protein [Bacteroidota bacterium]